VKVYLATAGEYSDYRVLQVFARREDAESYELGEDVEEWDVEDGPVEMRTWHSLHWWPARPEGRDPQGLRMDNPFERSSLRDFDSKLRTSHHWHQDGLIVEGWDLNAVHKVYSEQRAQHIARREGIA
jgi:hypothetical protein